MSAWSARIAAVFRRRRVWAALGLFAIAIWLGSGVYTVAATSVAVTRLFGVTSEAVMPPGVHWWWPRPIGRVDRVEVTRTFALSIGLRPPTEPVSDDESRWLTGDTNILHLRSKVSWRIAEPARFLFRAQEPARILESAVGSAFTSAASGLPVDEILTAGRLVLRESVRERTQAMLDRWQVGIQILAVDLEAVEPPAAVVSAFQEVQNARADRERLVSEAETYANTTIPVARGEAEKRQQEALGWRDQRLNAAYGDAERFGRLTVEHARAPGLLERRLYLETAERVLPRVRRYVLEPGSRSTMPITIIE